MNFEKRKTVKVFNCAAPGCPSVMKQSKQLLLCDTPKLPTALHITAPALHITAPARPPRLKPVRVSGLVSNGSRTFSKIPTCNLREKPSSKIHIFLSSRAFRLFKRTDASAFTGIFLRANKQLVRKHCQRRISVPFKKKIHRSSLIFMIHAKKLTHFDTLFNFTRLSIVMMLLLL